MKKQKKFAELNATDALAKQAELIKELVQYKVSMDPAHLKSANGVVGLKNDLKAISRKMAQFSKSSR